MPAAIVIFGAAVRPGGRPSETLRRRVEAAIAFGRSLDGPLYVPTGGLGRHPPTEARVMARLLLRAKIPRDRIRLEETGRDTLSSALAVADLLRGHGGPVFAVSSAYHLPRCVLLLRMAGLAARAAPPPRQPVRDIWRWWLREGAALPYDAALMLWHRVITPSPAGGRGAGE